MTNTSKSAKAPKTVAVTALKRLGSQAPTFDLPVTITQLDGAQVKLTIQCKALRKTEWAKLRDENHRTIMEAVLKRHPEAAEATTEEPVDPVAEVPVDPAEAPAAPEGESAIESALDNILSRGHEANIREGLGRDADLILKFATGWDLEDAFDVEHLQLLEDEYGGSMIAILSAYETAIYQGRLGN